MARITGFGPGLRGIRRRTAAPGRSVAWLLLLPLLAGCHIEPITPTAAASPSVTPTKQLPLASLLPTLDRTATAQPPAVPSPTAESRLPPGIGSIIFRDPMDSNHSEWPLSSDSAGSASFTSGMFTFTVRTPRTSILSVLPRDFPSDVYVEVTVTTEFCGADLDAYGILFRVQTERNYRMAFTCSGQIHLERDLGFILEGAKAWQPAPGLLSGAPAENRIGLLIRGSEFRVFAAGLEVYSTNEPLIPSGRLGLFARTEKSNLLTVAFRDLVVYSLAQ